MIINNIDYYQLFHLGYRSVFDRFHRGIYIPCSRILPTELEQHKTAHTPKEQTLVRVIFTWISPIIKERIKSGSPFVNR